MQLNDDASRTQNTYNKKKFKTTTLKSKMQKILMVLDYYAKTFRSFDQYHTDAN